MSTFIVRILTLLGILSICQNSDLDVKTQLPRHIILEHYTVELDLSTIENDFYVGTCSIRIRLDRPTKSIHFHTGKQQIVKESLKLIQVYPLEFYTPMASVHKSDSMDVYFANELSEGDYIWRIDFITTLNDEEAELFTTTYADEEGERIAWLLGTNGAREIFPCWDEPVFESIFEISIIHLTKHTVLSNMPVRETYRHDERLTWTHFHETPVIPPNLLAIVVSDFVYITNRINERISLRCRQQAALHLEYAKLVIEDVTLHFESQSRRYKEIAKVDHVVIPAFPHSGMVKLGLIIYSERDLVFDEKVNLVTRKIDVAQSVARFIAHQNLDNLISSAFLSTTLMCLQKGIFELNAINAVNKIYPEFRIWDMFVVETQQAFLRLDSLKSPITNSLVSEDNSTEPNSIFFSYCHRKASIIFRMLKHALGDDVFWNGYEILRKYKRLVNYDDLWVAMQIALDKSNNVYKFDIKDMMNPWTKLKNYLVLKVEQHNNTYVKIYNMYPLNQEVQIPLTFTTQDKSNFIDTSPYFLMSLQHTIYLPLNLSGWIIMNIQQAGYYRVNYDAIYWDRIINYLRTSDKYTKIHVLNRAQIIDDALYFLINDQLPLSTFLELTKYLERETDYIVWFPMIVVFKHMPELFLPGKIKTHVRNILHELLKNITYTDKPNEKPDDFIKCLRREAVKWGCLFGDPNCKETAKISYRDEL